MSRSTGGEEIEDDNEHEHDEDCPYVALGRSHPASDRRIRCLSISNNSSMLRSRFLAWAINFD
jgi:hypothetical protein